MVLVVVIKVKVCESGVIYGFGDPSDVGNVGLGNGGSIVGSS